MLNSTNNQPVARLTEAGGESYDTVDIFYTLLAQSIHLRDLYKKARRQAADIRHNRLAQLCNDHYREQVHLVDVLIDRIRTLGGAGRVLAGDFLCGPPVYQAPRSWTAITHLLGKLLDAHESILTTASPAGVDRLCAHDFAFGQVVLTNDQQSMVLGDYLLEHAADQGIRVQARMVRAAE